MPPLFKNILIMSAALSIVALASGAQAQLELDSLLKYPGERHTYFWAGDWQPGARVTSTADGSERVIDVVSERYNEDSARWDPQTRIVQDWTTHPGPDTVTEYLWSLDDWSEEKRTIFTYDDQGRVEVKLEQARPFAFWSDNFRTTYTYTGDDLSMELIEVNGQGGWENYHMVEYTYIVASAASRQSLLSEALRYFWHLGEWLKMSRTTYSYSGGLETEKLEENWSLGSWVPEDRMTNTYAGTELQSRIGQTWDGSAWQDVTRALYQDYDDMGRALTVFLQFGLGGSWENSTKEEYVFDTPTSVDGPAVSTLPDGLSLHQNYPNPFNPSTTIQFSLSRRSVVSVEVIDILGRKVTDLHSGELPSGDHLVEWDGRDRNGNNVASGMYFYRLQTESGSLSRKMLLLK